MYAVSDRVLDMELQRDLHRMKSVVHDLCRKIVVTKRYLCMLAVVHHRTLCRTMTVTVYGRTLWFPIVLFALFPHKLTPLLQFDTRTHNLRRTQYNCNQRHNNNLIFQLDRRHHRLRNAKCSMYARCNVDTASLGQNNLQKKFQDGVQQAQL